MSKEPSLPSTYKTITLKENVQGEPTVDHFSSREDQLDADHLQDGHIIVHTVYLSVDPYILGKIGADKNRTFGNPLKPGDAIIGRIVGEVVRSKSPKYKVGDACLIDYQWSEYAVVKDDVPEKIDPATIQDVPLSYYMGVVGMPGQTAYWGLLDVGQPKEGDVVVVSAAAGAVGSLVTQIAKIKGAKAVIGVAGGPEKCKDLTDKFGCTHAIDYKSEDIAKKLDELFPDQKDGFVDVYFDNVGYDQLEALIPRMKMGGRIATCGQIGGYTKQEDKEPTKWRYLIHYFLWRCLKMQGFLAGTYRPRYAESSKQLSEWVRSGQLKYEEDVYELQDISAAPAAFLRLFKGQNRGKQVVHVADSLFGYK